MNKVKKLFILLLTAVMLVGCEGNSSRENPVIEIKGTGSEKEVGEVDVKTRLDKIDMTRWQNARVTARAILSPG